MTAGFTEYSLSRSLRIRVNNILFPIYHNISLSRLSTFAIGGLVKNYIPVERESDLVRVLDYLHHRKVPFRIFSGGSNIVFPDEGLDLFLIHFKNGSFKLEGSSILADAGVPLTKVIHIAIENGLQGMENLSGIPGSIGGALVGNAGAYGSSISDALIKVKIWHQGKIKWLDKKDCQFSYRESIFKHQPFCILRGELKFIKSDHQRLKKISDEIIKIRKQKYKKDLKYPGSFFKNIEVKDLSDSVLKKIDPQKIIAGKVPAGYLLDSVGARGMNVGDIIIADFHGNLFINNGTGKERDVKKLANVLKKKVYQKFGILLEEEIRYL